MPVGAATPDLVAHLRRTLAAQDRPGGTGLIGIAVSGGGDSISLMHLAARAVAGARLRIVSVNHGLRAEAADEIALVAEQAARLGLPHEVLDWRWDGQGNLQAAARDGRWAAIRRWSDASGVDTILLGHTEDDQLETLLMRLARGSGIDGLTGMARADWRDGLRVVRPLLDVPRAVLRNWLRQQKIPWCDDPSNEDPRFDRVRARQMFAQLETLGLSRKRLLQTAEHMQAAHLSLQRAAQDFARSHVRQDTGDLVFDKAALALDKEDAPRRVMVAALAWVGGSTYKPRFDNMLDAVTQAVKGRTVTLGGCILSAEPGGGARMTREAAATRTASREPHQIDGATGVLWDRRWFLEGPMSPRVTVSALADGLRQCPHWRDIGLPRKSLLGSPAVWQDSQLLAAPVAGFGNGWSARIVADFHSAAFAIED